MPKSAQSDKPLQECTYTEAFERLKEHLADVWQHGYGKVEVCIQDSKVVNLQTTKSFK